MNKLFVEEESLRCLLCYDAPCSKVCPAQTNPAKFIRSIRFKNYKGAINTIRDNNIFGATCSEICNEKRYCEKACIRNKIDRPISIKSLQNYLMEIEDIKYELNEVKHSKGNICVIGGDIKGFSAANEFLKNDYSVTLFSKLSIEDYLKEYLKDKSLSTVLLNKDIQSVVNKGLNIKMYIPSVQEIRKNNYNAILFAAEDVQDIYLNHDEIKEKSFYLNKLINGRDDIVFSVKTGKEAAKKVINSIK